MEWNQEPALRSNFAEDFRYVFERLADYFRYIVTISSCSLSLPQNRGILANSAEPVNRQRRVASCSHCHQQGHYFSTCPESGYNNLGSSSNASAGSRKRGRPRTEVAPTAVLNQNSVVEPVLLEEAAPNSDDDFSLHGDDEPIDDLELDPALKDDMEGPETAPVIPTQWRNVDIPPNPSVNLRGRGLSEAAYGPDAPNIRQGAVNIPQNVRRPGQFLDLLFTGEILDQFVTSTNAYVRAQAKPAWPPNKDVTALELKKYFGLSLYMGIVQLPDRKMHWETGIFGGNFPARVKSRKRFCDISYNLHWLDTSNVSPAERAERNKADGFWTVSTFLLLLLQNFQAYYRCGKYLSVDEMCIFFKGRHRCRCYNPNKPNKWHLKAYCLNCADTGYLSNFFMYAGKDEERPDDLPATVYPVVKLTEPSIYHGKGHVMCTDNWYTSIDLVKILSSAPRDMHFVGTVRVNKRGLDPTCVFRPAGPGKKQRGAMQSSKLPLENACTPFIYQSAWMDSKPVHLLSTFPTYYSECERGQRTATRGFARIKIPRPTVIGAYNEGMGGTDKIDQLVSYYDDRYRTVKWQMRVYLHFLHVAVVNASVLHNCTAGPDNQVSLLQATRKVIEEWCGVDLPGIPVQAPVVVQINPYRRMTRSNWQDAYTIRSTGFHDPIRLSTIDRNQRGKCIVCGAKAQKKCRQCGVFLHLSNQNDVGCWRPFHEYPTF